MIATAERPSTMGQLEERCSPTGTEAQALALAYLRYASACWRGEMLAPVFATRLGAYWSPALPPAPAGGADAISPHGGGGRGIHWYQTGQAVIGYVPGAEGGYQVPVSAIPQLVRCAPSGPCVTGITVANESRRPGSRPGGSHFINMVSRLPAERAKHAEISRVSDLPDGVPVATIRMGLRAGRALAPDRRQSERAGRSTRQKGFTL
jgi:hypothetical protein